MKMSSSGLALVDRSVNAFVTFSRVARALHLAAALIRVFAEIRDVGGGHAVLLRGVDDRLRPLVEFLDVLLVAADAGNDEEVRVLRDGERWRETEEGEDERRSG